MTLVEGAESTAESRLRIKGGMRRWLSTQAWYWMGDHCCGQSGIEVIARSVVGWRWLRVYLTECTTSGRTIALRSAVRFRSVLYTGNLIALDLDGLLRFDHVLV